jgi:hypothetical protein
MDGTGGDSTNGTVRYARWATFDKIGDSDQRACWLDRKTGRLVYEAVNSDPNGPAANPPYSDRTEVW